MIKYFAWLFPVIFIFHDMEEIIGMGIFLKKNKEFLLEKYPRLIGMYKDFSTEGFALAVYEELILCIILSILVVFTDFSEVYYLWFGGFIGCAFHFIVHIGQTLVIGRYVPAVITSILCLPVSIFIIYNCLSLVTGFYSVFWIICGIFLVFMNLIFVHRLISWFTLKMEIPRII